MKPAKAPTGALGGSSFKWDKKSVLDLALTYSTRKEFRTKSRGAYKFASRHKFIKELIHKSSL